jgi:hypothetical protein
LSSAASSVMTALSVVMASDTLFNDSLMVPMLGVGFVDLFFINDGCLVLQHG